MRGKPVHTNLFRFGHSRREVKDALARHQKRDGRVIHVLDIIMIVCVLYLARNLPRLDTVAAGVAVWTAMTGMRYFIDQSVRNFYLHRLDWEEAGPDEEADIL